MYQVQKIQKWGNSMAVRLPKEITKKLELHEGGVVTITIEKENILLRPLKKSKPKLKDLVKDISPFNRHAIIQWGKPRGKEIW